MTDIAIAPTTEQEQRAKWDLLLLDLETRAEQVRQLKTYEGKRLVIQGLTAGAALFAAGAGFMTLVFHLWGKG
jgi:hypothetical protein